MTALIAQAQAAAQINNQVETLSSSDLVFIWIAMMVSFITLIVLAERLHHGRILPYEPRRQVPWSGGDVFLIFMVVVMLQILVMAALSPYMLSSDGAGDTTPAVSNDGAPPGSENGADPTAHPVVSIVLTGNPWMIAFCVLVTVVLAPIFEEFLFRLVLQGWLEKADTRWRRRFRWLKRLPRGMLPILIVSLFFAFLHARTDESKFDLEMLIFGFIVQAIVNLIGLVFGVLWLVQTGAKPADFGWRGWAVLFDDIFRGIFAFFLIAGPIFGLQVLMKWLLHLPEVVDFLGVKMAPDPFAIFFFSVALGYLYFRTHRIAVAITLHVALNLTSMALLAVSLIKG